MFQLVMRVKSGITEVRLLTSVTLELPSFGDLLGTASRDFISWVLARIDGAASRVLGLASHLRVIHHARVHSHVLLIA